MKTLFLSSILAAITLVAAAPSAEARPYRGHHHHHATTIVVTGYTSWGAPIRAERYFLRYGPTGHVVWGYRPLPVVRSYCPPPHRHYYRDRGYDRRHTHYHRGHGYRGHRGHR
ncbi:MAG: hypothetical protein QM627_13310 [Luteolibacter sp.]